MVEKTNVFFLLCKINATKFGTKIKFQLISFGLYHAVEIEHTILLLVFVAEKVLLHSVIYLTVDTTKPSEKILVFDNWTHEMMIACICANQLLLNLSETNVFLLCFVFVAVVVLGRVLLMFCLFCLFVYRNSHLMMLNSQQSRKITRNIHAVEKPILTSIRYPS